MLGARRNHAVVLGKAHNGEPFIMDAQGDKVIKGKAEIGPYLLGGKTDHFYVATRISKTQNE